MKYIMPELIELRDPIAGMDGQTLISDQICILNQKLLDKHLKFKECLKID